MRHTIRRSLTRSTIGLMAVIGLLFVVSVPVLAEHETNGPAVAPTSSDFPGGPPQCPAGTTGVRFGPGSEDDAPLALNSTAGGVTLTEINIEAGTVSFSVESGKVAALVFMKGGTPHNVYDYRGFPAGGVAHDDDLVTPNNSSGGPAGISHIDFCVGVATVVSTATATATATEATSTSTATTATATATTAGAVLGGNPTVAPAAVVPNTATGGPSQVPTIVLSAILLGSLGSLVVLRLTHGPSRLDE